MVNNLSPPAGGGHNMLRVRVCATHKGGFLGRNSLNKGPFFGRFSIKLDGLSRSWRKIAKNWSFSAKIHHKSGYESMFRQLEEGTFLKTGLQTPVHPQVMYPPGLNLGREINIKNSRPCHCSLPRVQLWPTISGIIPGETVTIMYKSIYSLAPKYLSELFSHTELSSCHNEIKKHGS